MAKVKARTLGDFVETYDKSHIIPKAIRAGIAQLGKSGWEGEAEFIKRCAVCNTDFAKYRNQFADFFVELPVRKGGRAIATSVKRAWCGSKEFADALRERVAA